MNNSSTHPARQVSRKTSRGGVFSVWTQHPQFGRMERGTIRPVRTVSHGAFMTWSLTNPYHDQHLVLVGGDYLTAEEVLLDWTDVYDELEPGLRPRRG